jgi:hypothetical protein
MPRRTALAHLTEGLSVYLGVPKDDPALQGMCVAILDASKRLYQVTAAGHGSVKIYIEDGWLKGTAFEMTDLPDPENRRPGK